MWNRRLSAKGIATALLLGASSLAAGQSWWWPPEMCVEPAHPTTADPITIHVGGEWPDSCVPCDGIVSPPVGGQIAFDLLWPYPPEVACLQVITPWTQARSLSPLPAGTYDVVCTLLDGEGSVLQPPVVAGTFTVTASWYLGDMNCDGAVDFDDIDPFVLALCGPQEYGAAHPDCRWLNADCDGDGCVDFDDIDLFVAILQAGGPYLSDCWHGECEFPTAGDRSWCPADAITLTVQGSTLQVLHTNAEYNCCLDDIAVDFWMQGNVLHFYEEEILSEPCFCICCYEVGAAVSNLAPGVYVVEYCWFEYDLNDVTCYEETITIP